MREADQAGAVLVAAKHEVEEFVPTKRPDASEKGPGVLAGILKQCQTRGYCLIGDTDLSKSPALTALVLLILGWKALPEHALAGPWRGGIGALSTTANADLDELCQARVSLHALRQSGHGGAPR